MQVFSLTSLLNFILLHIGWASTWKGNKLFLYYKQDLLLKIPTRNICFILYFHFFTLYFFFKQSFASNKNTKIKLNVPGIMDQHSLSKMWNGLIMRISLSVLMDINFNFEKCIPVEGFSHVSSIILVVYCGTVIWQLVHQEKEILMRYIFISVFLNLTNGLLVPIPNHMHWVKKSAIWR